MNDYLILSTMKEKCQGEKTGNYQAYTLPETPVNRHSLSNHSDLIVLSIRSFVVLKYLHMRRDLQDLQKSLAVATCSNCRSNHQENQSCIK